MSPHLKVRHEVQGGAGIKKHEFGFLKVNFHLIVGSILICFSELSVDCGVCMWENMACPGMEVVRLLPVWSSCQLFFQIDGFSQ